jgi:hypothetical protein
MAQEKIVLTGRIVIDKPTTYKNIFLDLTHANLEIINNATLHIENCIVNGIISPDNPFLIKVSSGSLNLKNNIFNTSSINLPTDPKSPTIYNLINVVEGKIDLFSNRFFIKHQSTVGFLVTGISTKSKFYIKQNLIDGFHGGVMLRNTTEANILNNTFKNVSFGNIYVVNGYNILIKGNIILFPGNNNVGDGIDIIASDKVDILQNYIFSGSCYSILILKSKNMNIDRNIIVSGITYAISIYTSLGKQDQYATHLNQFIIKNNIKLNPYIDNQNITVTHNYLSQNRYGLSAVNVNGLNVQNNVFIQFFVNDKDRKFWTDNYILFKNVLNVNWANNLYKEAFSQNDDSNEKSFKFIEFPVYGGVKL